MLSLHVTREMPALWGEAIVAHGSAYAAVQTYMYVDVRTQGT